VGFPGRRLRFDQNFGMSTAHGDEDYAGEETKLLQSIVIHLSFVIFVSLCVEI
jgi:hypothetical protein